MYRHSKLTIRIAVIAAIWSAGTLSERTGAMVSADEGKVRVVRDLVYARPDSGVLRADLYLPPAKQPYHRNRRERSASTAHSSLTEPSVPDQGRPAVLMIHGGAWAAGMRTHAAWHARHLARAGFAALTIDYRLAPIHKFPAQLDDCQAALTWLASNGPKYSIAPQRLAAFGYSAGGHLACLLGSKTADIDAGGTAQGARLKAVVAGGTPCDFRYEPLDSTRLAFWLGGSRRKVPEAYREASPIQYVNPQSPPTFFFHGANDRVVPPENPLRLHRQLKQSNVATEWFLIPNAGHVSAYTNRRALAAAIRFLRTHLLTVSE